MSLRVCQAAFLSSLKSYNTPRLHQCLVLVMALLTSFTDLGQAASASSALTGLRLPTVISGDAVAALVEMNKELLSIARRA
jgi:hypothetical protein